ncbi:AAA family ATPase [Paenibacillus sacheonensis]|uniref:AAA family ATPase n=1 Tax=Paenibacillus sacheonensis TaxID=742054 RepID=A0A7X5BX45_9BACL|nr:AAA family ATPase [Paenibacillus sacheonensis]MBM7563449.1 NadR type nicotinamide-nucleotide adenylyltransferase [Paenibacillus sacheonensis]NBC67996.1 AAA family ATPase [Paenibacillus sacheonensis]
MNERRTGLTLGKFAPLHRGHQLMIETAIQETDDVIVVIYDCPETTDIPLNVRAGWIRTLYPQVQVIEAWDGPAAMGDTPEIKQLQEYYILGLLNGRRVTHFYSSEFYGEHMSAALGAENRQVDVRRIQVPVSGTQVRLDPYANREFVSPVVYNDLIAKAVLLGAPSTGKTTLAAYMAERMNTAWMPEYGREYWEQHQTDRRLAPEQLEEIAAVHIEREDRLTQDAREVLFVDTNAITTYMFALDYHGSATQGLTLLAERAAARYDLVFLCDTDIPYDDTWDRSGAVHREVFQKQIEADLRTRRIPYILLRGSLSDRAEQVEAILRKFRKYRSPFEWMGRDA